MTRDGRLPRALWPLLVARGVNQLGAFSLAFLTVLLTTGLRADLGTAGLVTAAFGVATIPSRLAGGRLADRLGRRRTIVLGLTGCAVAQLGVAAARTLPEAAVCAVLLGLAFEVYEPPSQALVADVVPAAQRVRAYGLLTAAPAIGGMGSGLLAAALGRWGLRPLFVADALTSAVCAAVVRFALPADRPDRAAGPRHRAPRPPGGGPWRGRRLLAPLFCGTGYALVVMEVMTALPLSLAWHGVRPADAGLLFTVSAATVVAVQPLLRAGPLAALPPSALLALGQVLAAAGLAGYALAHSMAAMLAASVVWGLSGPLVQGPACALVAELAPPGAGARYLAVYGLGWGVAAVGAPLVGTGLLRLAGPAALWSAAAVVCLVLAAVQPPLARRTRRLSTPPAAPAPPASRTRPPVPAPPATASVARDAATRRRRRPVPAGPAAPPGSSGSRRRD
ncbi:Arabinose efflux permease family protein (plasmid) [Streptantibioticus cattleyicolor NRRL 8057 = DSM 46488]|nr:Arabinose efflux permease family protein [Streptantibioticus cattleyicolor NRRL 8057 = DSM 46488]